MYDFAIFPVREIQEQYGSDGAIPVIEIWPVFTGFFNELHRVEYGAVNDEILLFLLSLNEEPPAELIGTMNVEHRPSVFVRAAPLFLIVRVKLRHRFPQFTSEDIVNERDQTFYG